MEVIELTKELVSIYSPSGKEKKVAEFIKEKLREIGLKIKIQKLQQRFNVFAYIGKPRTILSSHMDTVPGFLKVKEDKNFIYGRGSCDAKGIIASMICAAKVAIETNLNNFGLLFTVSEETDFSGVKKAANMVSPRFVVIGEPTNLKLAFGQRGLIGIRIKSYGKSASGATPEKGESAIYKLVDFITEVRRIKFSVFPVLGNTALNIGLIKGGEAINVVPFYAEAKLEIRSVEESDTVIKQLERIAQKYNIKLEIMYSYNPVASKINEEILQFLGVNKCAVPYFTEAYFWRKKAETFIFGPGDYKYAHTNKEKINKKQLKEAVKKYYLLIKYLTKK